MAAVGVAAGPAPVEPRPQAPGAPLPKRVRVTSGDAARPLLLVLAHGIGATELARLRGSGFGGAMPAAAVRLPDLPVQEVLTAGAAHELQDLGVAVDRCCLTLRPAARTDATAVEMLAQRATGPAEVTLFEARDILAQAMLGGPVAAAAAAEQFAALVERLGAVLRRGDAPELWFVGLGSPVAVHTTFDLAAAWQQHVLPPLADDLTLRTTPGEATVRADNQRALDLAAHALQRAPFASRGRVRSIGNSQLQFVADPGIAFAPHRLAARAPLPHEANGVACAPLGDLARAPELDLAQVLARFWMRAAALHADVADAITHEPVGASKPTTVDSVTPSRSSTPADLPAPTPPR
jgi:hypothetical protein